jgi:hypothetical protein
VKSQQSEPNRSSRVQPWIAAAVVTVASAVATSAEGQQTFSASDSVFAPGTWTVSVLGASGSKSGSASQVVNGFTAGTNAWLSTINPGGSDAWTVSIYENFYYDPSLNPGTPSSVTVSFDSRWVTQNYSRVGPAMRQGTTVWAGAQPLNSATWTNYVFTGWSAMLAGTGLPLPDFSATAAPIYFGFYQRNGGSVPGIGYQSEFANFSVAVTVPAPPVLIAWGVSVMGLSAGRRRPASRRDS